VGEVDGADLRTCQVDMLELGAAQVVPVNSAVGRTLADSRGRPIPCEPGATAPAEPRG
jgi:hypothetical protein